MALPPRLEGEIRELRADYQIDVLEEGDWISIVIHSFPLGDGYTVPFADLLIRAQRTYPDSGPDMFWLDVSVLLAGGQVPQAADSQEVHVSRNWRRFSWHRARWEPSVDNLHGYLEFIRRRLREKK